jgi:hypothetical protein
MRNFMAEGRMLKKKISLNEALANLENDSHRLLFTWAIPHLDIEGRISGSPRVFKASVAPLLDHLTPDKVLTFFLDAGAKGLINRYKIEGEWWIEFPKFKDNQNLRGSREGASKIPPPPANPPITPGELQEQSRSSPGELQENSRRTPGELPPKRREEKRSEEKGREEKLSATPPPPLGGNGDARQLVYACKHFDITQEFQDKLLREYLALTPEILRRELSKAHDWLDDNPNRHKRRSNGQLKNPKAFIRNWLERAIVNPTGPEPPGRGASQPGIKRWLNQSAGEGEGHET